MRCRRHCSVPLPRRNVPASPGPQQQPSWLATSCRRAAARRPLPATWAYVCQAAAMSFSQVRGAAPVNLRSQARSLAGTAPSSRLEPVR